jgi:hypothetical protein
MKIYLTAIAFLFAIVNSNAQKDSNKTSPLTLWGFADIYYAYDFNEPKDRIRNEMVNGSTHVYAHNRHNEFALNNGILGVKYHKEKVYAAFALHAGTYVNANYAAEPDALKFIYEAYAGYKITEKFSADAGIFASHIGSESALSTENLTLTRSMMADNTPYYESGVRVNYAANDKLRITGLILNGWQNIQDRNRNKALGSQVAYTGSKILLNWSTFYGKEAGGYENLSNLVSTDSLSTRRFFNDFFAQFDLGKKITMRAAFDIGIQKKRIGSGDYLWYNPNLILRYKLTDKIAFAGRLEYYHDKHGAFVYSGTPNGFQTFAPSLNVDFKLGENIWWRMEGRIFNSKDKVYVKKGKATFNDGLLISSLAIKF